MSLSASVYACITLADKVDLTSNWCFSISHQSINNSIIRACVQRTSKQGFSQVAPFGNFRGAKPYFGAHGEEETPVLIPNTEVKLPSGDYTAKVGN